jgi:hypothetical protein
MMIEFEEGRPSKQTIAAGGRSVGWLLRNRAALEAALA